MFQDPNGATGKKVMIFLQNDPKVEDCVDANSCARKCSEDPATCSAPVEDVIVMKDGVWSNEPQNNPFADYFKV